MVYYYLWCFSLVNYYFLVVLNFKAIFYVAKTTEKNVTELLEVFFCSRSKSIFLLLVSFVFPRSRWTLQFWRRRNQIQTTSPSWWFHRSHCHNNRHPSRPTRHREQRESELRPRGTLGFDWCDSTALLNRRVKQSHVPESHHVYWRHSRPQLALWKLSDHWAS